jgi:SSS family solute:Na+ symporter
MAFGIDYIWCIIGMAVLTGIYVVAGGYLATAVNDFIQGIIMLAGIIAVVVSVINGNGGFSSALAGLSEKGADFTAAFGPDPKALLGVVVLTSLGTWGLPQMVHKFYAIKDIKMISKGAIISTLFAVIVAGGCYLLGGFARLYDTADIYAAGTTNVIFDAIIPAMVSGLPDILIGIIMMLVFSASMSTLSALVLTSASTLTLDLIKPVFVKRMDDKRQLLNVRILIVIFTILSAALATVQYKSAVTFIAQLMGISWGALAGSFLAPFLYGLYLKRVTRAAVWASFICGVGLTVSNMFLKFIASPINAGAITMLASLVIVPIVSLLTPKLDDITVERAFKTLRD